MAISFSSALGVDKKAFERAGILDAVIGIDTRMFLDPFLLKRTRIPEFRQSRRKIEKYYQDVITLLLASRTRGDKAWQAALRRLTFKEQHGVSIGYGVHTGNGSAIGRGLAQRLITTAREILDMGIKDPDIFELIGLFEEDFGADRLSDMTIDVIREDIFRFTHRISRQLRIKNLMSVRLGDTKFKLPHNPVGKEYLLLLPKILLSPLPVAMGWSGIEQVIAHNQELRQRLNNLIGASLKKRISKRQIKDAIFSNPENIKQLLATYKTSQPVPYDYVADPAGETSWYPSGEEFARRFPLTLQKRVASLNDLESVVSKIIEQFKRNIEQNDSKRLLYIPHGLKQKPRHERYAQHLFYAIADSYCEANDVDISREPNAGNGPVDFKISQGYEKRVVVEIKLSSHHGLIRGLEKQVPTYQRSERARRAFYVVIKVTDSDRQLKVLNKVVAELDKSGKHHPEVVIIDAVIKPPASKRK